MLSYLLCRICYGSLRKLSQPVLYILHEQGDSHNEGVSELVDCSVSFTWNELQVSPRWLSLPENTVPLASYNILPLAAEPVTISLPWLCYIIWENGSL